MRTASTLAVAATLFLASPGALPQPRSEIVITDCEATISLEYTQRGAVARVRGEIVNDMCPASSGSFVVSIRTADDGGTIATQDYPETWQRSDDQPVSFSKDYPIGDNVDLVRVRTLKGTCKCAATPQVP